MYDYFSYVLPFEKNMRWFSYFFKKVSIQIVFRNSYYRKNMIEKQRKNYFRNNESASDSNAE